MCLIAGNALTASIHIITVVIGAGVLALAWAMAQLGWILGIASILTFSSVSIFTYSLVADCYRYPDPVTGKRNYTYMQAVKAYLGILHFHNLIIAISIPKYCYWLVIRYIFIFYALSLKWDKYKFVCIFEYECFLCLGHGFGVQ